MTKETLHFQTEIQKLLDLMINSLYSHKEIFLRELISNASDALDTLRFKGQTEQHLLEGGSDFKITIEVDKDARTLSISDNGIGMTHDEVVEHIGTIAKSGTGSLLAAIADKEKNALTPDLIGQFGVGFYSSFMVAERVVLTTRAAGSTAGVRWESTGDGTYTIEEYDRSERGTTVTVYLRPIDGDEQDFTQEWVIRSTVKKYSDFVTYPIRMDIERQETPTDEEGKPIEGAEPVKKVTTETLNSMKPVWNKRKSEVTDEEYQEFYRHISHDWSEPLETLHVNAEGKTEYNALMYIPSQAGFDLFMPEKKSGMQLYVKRVFIMDNCEDLMPSYLRFIKGVVDSADLSLNVSREILQHDRLVALIRKNLIRKVLDSLKNMLEQDREKYLTFWQAFGQVLKEGIHYDYEHKDALQDLLLVASTRGAELTTLKEYVSRMPEGQKEIYYLTGENREMLASSPHLEALKRKGYEVLLMTDPVDEWVLQTMTTYQEKSLKSLAKGEVALLSEEEKKASEEQLKADEEHYSALLTFLKNVLKEQVKEAKLSSRLTDSPACLVADEHDMSASMQRLLKAAGQEVPETKRIMEINPQHPLIAAIHDLYVANPSDPRLVEYGDLLFDQALLAEGSPVSNPVRFAKLVTKLMVQAAT
ncbi:MAG: molecular chaperone HtpG [Deltaproteobacteria bacterium]|nr:molecular chaperone HtpG [Candidatus Anaeroferrophillus wilburensis]MBN2890124.1 molecular chaperone HtpG [Deltaproteobacteria bacterium]